MFIRSRKIRRLGALALLLAWAPVATANAVTCGIWCELNGGAAAHYASAHGEHHHAEMNQASPGAKVTGPDCASPDLLLVTAVGVEAVAVPAVVASPVAVHTPTPESFVSSFPKADTPPPRV